MAERMPDQTAGARIDFDGLRGEVEAAVKVPPFSQVTRRARWRRARTRLTTATTVLLTVGILGPAGVVADLHRTTINGWVAPDGPHPEVIDPSITSSAAPQSDILAVAGADIAHIFLLVDTCLNESCDLRLYRLNAGSATPARPLADHLLRASSTSWLDSVSLTALSDTSVIASGLTDGSAWKYKQIDVAAADGPPALSHTPTATTADRPVQLTHLGDIQAVQNRTGRLLQLPSQPPLNSPSVVDNLAPAKGIWVVGSSFGGELAVSVSTDAGRTWITRPLGLNTAQVSGYDQPILASYTGRTAYLLVRLADEEFALYWTNDAGQTWGRRNGQLPWPQPIPVGAPYGLVVRPDGTLLAWLASSPTITYLESTDRGATFRVTSSGPGGPVFALPDGYVQLGSPPAVSRDAASWAAAPITYPGPGG
jgi:hypothetical protein